MASDNIKVCGGCFCGAVRYEATHAPLASMVCHCQSCRRIAGAPVVPWVTFPKTQFVVSGPVSTFNSSPGVRRTFCAACNTPITYESEKYSDEVDVTTSTLDDPNAFPPTHHSWLSHDLNWIRFGDGLPTYPQSRNTPAFKEP